MDVKILPIVALVVLVVGLLLHIVGLATPAWSTFGTGVEGERGLWELCLNDVCQKLENPDDFMKASQAMAILGVIAAAVAVGLAVALIVISYFEHKPVTMNVIAISSLAVAALSFFMIIICVIIYAAKTEEAKTDFDYGYSFGLSVTGAIIILIGGFVSCFASLIH